MLVELDIKDFAIIDHLRLTLAPGFNVLTGETGAGKSIVIDAVTAVLGAKMGFECLRAGCEQAHVEAIFSLAGQAYLAPLLAYLDESGLGSDDNALILRRDLHSSGRTVARINGRAVPLPILQRVGQYLVDIHGQSEHLSLTKGTYQLDLLDGYAGLSAERDRLAVAVAELRGVRREIERLSSDEREVARRTDLLRFQVNEIEAARLRVGEEEDLERERNLLANAERLAAGADAVYQALYGGDGLPAASDRLGEAAAHLADMAKVDGSLEAQAVAVAEASYQVEEIGRVMRAYRDAVEFNPARLDAVEERLALVFELKRKYGRDVSEILAYGRRAAEELEALGNREERRTSLRDKEERLLSECGALAAALSAARQAAGTRLAAAVEAELQDLNLKKTKFVVQMERSPSPQGVPLPGEDTRFVCDTTGIDRVAFAIAPNPGEPLKPLARIASGGEMSRLLLALKTVLSSADPVPTLIFDEVDVGLGGRSGGVIGEKLSHLAGRHQVICVTHLPQIAAFAEAHFNVGKREIAGRTVTRVEPLNEAARVAEIAAMLAGEQAGETTRRSAHEMLSKAHEWKEKVRSGR